MPTFNIYNCSLELKIQVEARSADDAIKAAKAQNIVAPIVSPYYTEEELRLRRRYDYDDLDRRMYPGRNRPH